MSLDASLKYTAEHEWVAVDGDVARIGITAYAADKLGDVVFVDLPKVGQEAVAAGPAPDAPVLVGLAAEGKRAGRAGYPVFRTDDAEAEPDAAGEITSGALSPTLGHPIAMAFVDPDVAEAGTELEIDVRGSRVPASVVPLPFYKREK